MQTTDYADVLAETAEACSLDPLNLSSDEFSSLRRFHKKRLKIAWEYHFWPDVGRVEQRYYRQAWDSGTIYAAQAEVLYFPTQKYYQALQASTNQAPDDGSGNTNVAYWVECQPSHSANPYVAGTTYLQGNQVLYAGSVYQVYVASTTALPTDTTAWCILNDFDRYIAWEQTGETAIGVVAAVWKGNPRTYSPNGEELTWSLSEQGIQVATPSVCGWVEYRLRCPGLTGDVYDNSTSYSAGAQVYYSDGGTPGNFYAALTGTSPGQSPVTSPGSWSKVQIPLVFHDYLVHGAAADWLKGPGADRDAGATEEGLSDQAIERQRELLTAQQGQRMQTVVKTR